MGGRGRWLGRGRGQAAAAPRSVAGAGWANAQAGPSLRCGALQLMLKGLEASEGTIEDPELLMEVGGLHRAWRHQLMGLVVVVAALRGRPMPPAPTDACTCLPSCAACGSAAPTQCLLSACGRRAGHGGA
jgi:hypothetical protein